MNIGYRRYSGPCFMDATRVKSKRGAYLEKRLALIKTLQDRGNTVTIIQNGDDFSSFDKILVEFGSLNYMFHKKDIDFSNEVLKSGKAIFILDDPDMMPKDVFGATVWVNADPFKCAKKWKLSSCWRFPVSGLQLQIPPSTQHNGKVVYYGGTSGGRERMLIKYMALMPELEIYGHKKDYKHIIPKEPPTEDERANFYSGFMACLNVRDNLHRKLNWYTGRRYDAIIGGCPAIEENPEMFDIAKSMREPTKRLEIIKAQQEMVAVVDRNECMALLDQFGM